MIGQLQIGGPSSNSWVLVGTKLCVGTWHVTILFALCHMILCWSTKIGNLNLLRRKYEDNIPSPREGSEGISGGGGGGLITTRGGIIGHLVLTPSFYIWTFIMINKTIFCIHSDHSNLFSTDQNIPCIWDIMRAKTWLEVRHVHVIWDNMRANMWLDMRHAHVYEISWRLTYYLTWDMSM